MGTICTFDTKTHRLKPKQIESIRRLSRQVMAQLELRRRLLKITDLNQTLEEKVRAQVLSIERVSRFKRYLSPQIAQTILESENDDS